MTLKSIIGEGSKSRNLEKLEPPPLPKTFLPVGTYL